MAGSTADLLFHSARLLVAVVFLYAGFVKLRQGADLRITVSQVGMLPKRVQRSELWPLLPWIELAVGSLLTIRFFPVFAGIAALLLTLAFLAFHTYIVDIAPNSAETTCNCFGDALKVSVTRRSQLGAVALLLLATLNAVESFQIADQSRAFSQQLVDSAIGLGLAVLFVVVSRSWVERRKEARSTEAGHHVRLQETEYQA